MTKTTTGRRDFSRSFTRRDFLSTSLKAGTAAAFTTGLLPNLRVTAAEQYNVLFIIADDLRPLLGCYGHPEMYTPNIDRIAERGTLFNRAYCQYPLCNPSRTSMITGLRPDTTGVYNNLTKFRDVIPEVVTLPQHFKTYGYHTRSVGKIAHAATWDDELSWSAPIWSQRWTIDKTTTSSWQAFDVADDKLKDGKVASAAVEVLSQIKNQQFFLAVGFHKPHLPYNAPRKYYDLYDIEIFKEIPPVAPRSGNDVRTYADIPDGNAPFSKEKTLELMRAYAASTSYMDAQVGRVLDQLDVLGLTENTVIAFCGDHGFHLGEHGTWQKNTLFEVALHSPMIISMPGQRPNRTDALVELVDIYPTLCDACQLPTSPQLEGLSLISVIEQPTRPWKTAAFSRFSRTGRRGQSMRTVQYRYTEWGNYGKRGRELYDYYTDPDETVNIANLPENAELVAHLSEQLHDGWQAALPDRPEQTTVTQTLPWDINNDGIVDIRDLILVSNNFGSETSIYPKVDVNNDGSVDIIDLVLVASHLGQSSSPAAPSTLAPLNSRPAPLINEWLTEAHLSDDGSEVFQRGLANLERLLNSVIPEKTALLPNYPNPFNPETWIPYDLAQDADIYIHIYNVKGESIRQLSLGFQTAGTYRTPSRAAYWDGRNAQGETVASGIYFYTLHAGNVKAIGQMVIIK